MKETTVDTLRFKENSGVVNKPKKIETLLRAYNTTRWISGWAKVTSFVALPSSLL